MVGGMIRLQNTVARQNTVASWDLIFVESHEVMGLVYHFGSLAMLTQGLCLSSLGRTLDRSPARPFQKICVMEGMAHAGDQEVADSTLAVTATWSGVFHRLRVCLLDGENGTPGNSPSSSPGFKTPRALSGETNVRRSPSPTHAQGSPKVHTLGPSSQSIVQWSD
jgi:hypothetical protein